MPRIATALGVSSRCFGGGLTPRPEITEVTFNADVARSLHNTHFKISNASERVAIVLDCGAVAEITDFDFTGLTGNGFYTGGDGKYCTLVYDGSLYSLWFNSSTENNPGAPGTSIEVTINSGDGANDLASAFATALLTNSISNYVVAAAVVTVTDVALGAHADATAGTTLISVGVSTQGVDAASAVGGLTSIIVGISSGLDAQTIATNVAAAADAQGWTVTSYIDVCTFTDSSNGTRVDATNHGAAALIEVTQQGA